MGRQERWQISKMAGFLLSLLIQDISLNHGLGGMFLPPQVTADGLDQDTLHDSCGPINHAIFFFFFSD